MAKILQVANVPLLRFKTACFSQMSLQLQNGFARNGHFIVTYPDRDLCRSFGFGHMNFWGKRKLQDHFIKYCRFFKPDALIVGHVDTIENETFLKVKEELPHLRVLQWNVDWINTESENPTVVKLGLHNRENILRRMEFTDITLVTTADKKWLSTYKQKGQKVGFIPNPVDASLLTGRVFEKEQLPFDIMLCSAQNSLRQFCGKDAPVDAIAQQLLDNVPNLKPLFAGALGRPLLHANDYLEALKTSAMGLNLSRLNDTYLYSSDRLAHFVGNGQLAFVDRRVGYQDLFSDEEMAFYETPEELFEKIAFFKNHPKERMRVAHNGYDRYYGLFNERVVARYVEQLLFDRFDPKDYEWPTLI